MRNLNGRSPAIWWILPFSVLPTHADAHRLCPCLVQHVTVLTSKHYHHQGAGHCSRLVWCYIQLDWIDLICLLRSAHRQLTSEKYCATAWQQQVQPVYTMPEEFNANIKQNSHFGWIYFSLSLKICSCIARNHRIVQVLNIRKKNQLVIERLLDNNSNMVNITFTFQKNTKPKWKPSRRPDNSSSSRTACSWCLVVTSSSST